MVSIQLHEKVAAALAAQASEQGLSLEAYLSHPAEKGPSIDMRRLADDELVQLLDELSIDAQPLPDDFSRADVYQDHD